MLTIGQLAAYTGVTVRAIRHYHQRGLLAEPARDSSGYRRYDGPAVVDLIRIKTLAEAGNLAAVALMASHIVGSSPAWERLNELSEKRPGALHDETRPR